VLQRHYPKRSWRLSLWQLLLLLRWLQWQLPWPDLPLWHLSQFRWTQLMPWHLNLLRLQRWQPNWQRPRWQARFHQPLWLLLAQLLRRQSPLRLRLPRRLPLLALRLV
jgi:hypothetical protein